MILLSNTLKANVTEFGFLLEKPSLQTCYIVKGAHLFSEVQLPLLCFVTPLWENYQAYGAHLQMSSVLANCLLKKLFFLAVKDHLELK